MLEGNLLIRASAGTGKTFSLATRYLRLMLLDKVDPAKIVALTFSRAAALTWSVWALAKQSRLPLFLSLRITYVQMRGSAVPHDLLPGFSGVSESQNVPDFSRSKRLFL